MVGLPSSSASRTRPAGLVLASSPGVNPLLRLAAKLRLGSALKSPEPPTDAALVPLYVEALQSGTLDPEVRARVCRAITYKDGTARCYVAEWIPFYVEAVCAFADDPRCVLFVLALLQAGVIDARSDLDFSQGVYAAALFFDAWETIPERVAFGLPAYKELRRDLAALYAAQPTALSADRVRFVEAVYAEIGTRLDAELAPNEREELAQYLVLSRDGGSLYEQDGVAAPGSGKYREWSGDPLDDPESILRGGSGNPEDDLRIARRYVEQGRDLDAAACALFARCIRYAETQDNIKEAEFWTVKLAQALIAVERVDEDTREILKTAASYDPDDTVLELAFLYSFAKNGGHEPIANDSDLARRLERVVLENAAVFQPLATRQRWNWKALERALALSWGHRGRSDTVARSLYKQVVDSHPDDRLLAGLYARALAQANVTDRSAIAVYERTLELGKANDAVRRALAIAYAKAGIGKNDPKRAQAVRLWEEMYRLGLADDTEIIAALGDSYVLGAEGGDIAIALWEKSAKADPKNGRVRLRLGLEMQQRGEIPEAIRLLKEAAKLLPEDFEAQYTLGILLHERNDAAGAVRFLKKAVTLPAGSAHKEAHFVLGEALLATEKRDESRQVFEKIVAEIDPDHAPTLLQLAKLNLRYEPAGAKRAEALFEKALALDATDPEGYRRLALLHEEQGRLADAEAAWEQYLALSPPDPVSTRKIADLYLKRGDFVRAESALRQTVALGGSDKKLFVLLGEVIVQAQKQRDGTGASETVSLPEEDEAAPASRTRRLTPRPTPVAIPQVSSVEVPTPTRSVTVPLKADLSNGVPAPKRQTIVTQNTVPPDPPPAPVVTPESPTSQNLTRSVGAAAIKAALRNRAARLAQGTPEELDKT